MSLKEQSTFEQSLIEQTQVEPKCPASFALALALQSALLRQTPGAVKLFPSLVR